jgi:hypothetical protein
MPSTNRSPSRAEIDAVLDLQTAGGYDKAGIRDIRLIGTDLVLDARTAVGLGGDCAETKKHHRQDDCELSRIYGSASERRCGPRNHRNHFSLCIEPPQSDASREMIPRKGTKTLIHRNTERAAAWPPLQTKYALSPEASAVPRNCIESMYIRTGSASRRSGRSKTSAGSRWQDHSRLATT